MMWFDKVIKGISTQQIINDSKTPSGKVHVGSLRGVLIHDALYLALKNKGVDTTFIYGIDDYDPLDGLPQNASAELQAAMGKPLCQIPAPAGSSASDLAEHYIAEFLDVFSELGVTAKIYRMRDIYRSGKFNESIDVILKKADIVRKVYRNVSHAVRADDWHPFQVICENCGKVGTTEVTAYDGKEVTYHCREKLVTWATGCGHSGKISPFDGNGKLPWKLEWVAKWHALGVTIEGAGKDHCTKGGSRDVAVRCLQAIFGEKAPLNVPYEFFLVSGAKMSSSKGVGSSARGMADFLPAEVLRFLMIRTAAKRTVNFSTSLEYIAKIFNDYDQLIQSSMVGKSSEDQKEMLRMVSLDDRETASHPISFQLLTALLQMPHLDLQQEIEKRVDPSFTTPKYQRALEKRASAARYWLKHYATDEERMTLQETLPESAAQLSANQKAFLQLLGARFPEAPLSGDEYQSYIFSIARLTPIAQPAAFKAIYCVLYNKDSGPKGGALFSYLPREFLIKRFSEVSYSVDAFWTESSIDQQTCLDWFDQHQDVSTVDYRYCIHTPADTEAVGVIELEATLTNDKTFMLRVPLSTFERALDFNKAISTLERPGEDLMTRLQKDHGVRLKSGKAPILYP